MATTYTIELRAGKLVATDAAGCAGPAAVGTAFMPGDIITVGAGGGGGRGRRRAAGRRPRPRAPALTPLLVLVLPMGTSTTAQL